MLLGRARNLALVQVTSVIVAAVFVGAVLAMTAYLGKPLLGPHAFRQTQTAISAQAMADDPTMFANYTTPVLGQPWRIPMELPVYQWIVARWHGITGMSLDASGKIISVLAWLACMGPAYVLLRSLQFSQSQALLALVVLLSSPLYLFWGAAFLIETTGVLFSIAMVACALRGQETKKARWFVTSLLCGVLAGLCKVTTWAPAVVVGGLLLVFRDGWRPWQRFWPVADRGDETRASARREAAAAAIACCCLLLPLVPAKLWINYADSIKAENPYAREIIVSTLPHMVAWNYGPWEQRYDPMTWHVIWRHLTDQLLVPFPIIGPLFMIGVLIAGAIASPNRMPAIVAFLAGFLAGPLVFTNLYFEHSYYWCANGVWFLLAVGVSLAGISEFRPQHAWPRIVATLLAVVIAVSGFTAWFQRFRPILAPLPTREWVEESWTKPVQAVVPPERTLLIVGHDWNPTAMYYAERKGIAQPTCAGIRFPGREFEEALRLLEPDHKLGAVVLADPLLTKENEVVLTRVLDQLGMSARGTRTAFGVLFPAKDLVAKRSE